MKQLFTKPAAAVLAAGALIATSSAAVEPAAYGAAATHASDTLVYAVSNFETDFDPASAYTFPEAINWFNTYQGLVTLAPGTASTPVPELATSWQANANNTTWTFHLRPNVKFTDGTPFNAEAVKDNFVRIVTVDLGTQSILGTYLSDPQKQIVVVNPLTVQFDFPHPVLNFARVLTAPWGVAIISPKVFTEHSTGPKDQGHAWLQTHAAPGTGPYIVSSISLNNDVVLTRNPNYWGGWSGDHFDKIIIESVPNGSTRREMIQTGGADIAEASTPEDTAALQKTRGATVVESQDIYEEYIILGDYGVTQSPKARLALEYSFPYEAFSKDISRGTIVPQHGVFPNDLFTADPNINLTTNLQKAKQLFAAAGIKPGMTLTYEVGVGGGGQDEGLALEAQLENIGIKLKIVTKAYSAYNTDLTTNRPVGQRANMYFWSWDPDYDDPADYSNPVFSSSQTPAHCPCYNSGYYVDKTVDEFIQDAFSGKLSATQYKSLSWKAQTVMAYDDPPWIAIGDPINIMYFRSNVKGYVASPMYIYILNFYQMSRG